MWTPPIIWSGVSGNPFLTTGRYPQHYRETHVHPELHSQFCELPHTPGAAFSWWAVRMGGSIVCSYYIGGHYGIAGDVSTSRTEKTGSTRRCWALHLSEVPQEQCSRIYCEELWGEAGAHYGSTCLCSMNIHSQQHNLHHIPGTHLWTRPPPMSMFLFLNPMSSVKCKWQHGGGCADCRSAGRCCRNRRTILPPSGEHVPYTSYLPNLLDLLQTFQTRETFMLQQIFCTFYKNEASIPAPWRSYYYIEWVIITYYTPPQLSHWQQNTGRNLVRCSRADLVMWRCHTVLARITSKHTDTWRILLCYICTHYRAIIYKTDL